MLVDTFLSNLKGSLRRRLIFLQLKYVEIAHGKCCLDRLMNPSLSYARKNRHKKLHFSFANSALACFRMGMSGSASFHKERKSLYSLRPSSVSPIITSARASCSREKAPRIL